MISSSKMSIKCKDDKDIKDRSRILISTEFSEKMREALSFFSSFVLSFLFFS